MIPKVQLSDYQYNLPEERIRKFALENRDDSKLITYNRGTIGHSSFKELPNLLPKGAALFFNNTKVIPARLYFTKDTGALIEIFLLNPVTPSNLVIEAMQVNNRCTWNCMIGNLKKWKDHPLHAALTINNKSIALEARLVSRDEKLVEFIWKDNFSFAEIVEAAGEVPLPPYFQREPIESDKERYQTVYSKNKGAVAAPTAGLHFTNHVLENIKKNNHHIEYLTLHVSAGTFQPVKDEDVAKHPMHSEQVLITRQNIESLIREDNIIAVGTTSMRTLESLYWFGVKLLKDDNASFHIEKLYPYEYGFSDLPIRNTAFQAIIDHMKYNDVEELRGDTEIFIMPGYQFQVCDGLITNFHQPGSTLLVLIAAFIDENWKKLYQEALDNDYQFLSYGDSSLLLP